MHPARVGAFMRVEAAVERRDGDRVEARATARTVGDDRRAVAEARAVFGEDAASGR